MKTDKCKVFVDDNRNYHNLSGPAIEWPNGEKSYYKHGERHRIGGPAIEWNHLEEWWVDGVVHRIDGPAVIDSEYGNTIVEWWIDGSKVDIETFRKVSGLSDEEITFMLLKYDIK